MSLTNDTGHVPQRKIVAYLAHPVSAPNQAGIDANLANARAWLKWLVDNTEWAVSAPWMPYVEAIPDLPGNPRRERGLADDLAILERHDLIVLVGGRVSSGMAMERDHAHAIGRVVADLTDIGTHPPRPSVAQAHAMLVVRAAERALRDGERAAEAYVEFQR